MTDEAPSPLRPLDPRVSALMREDHAAAVAAGYEDPLLGALAIAAMTIVRLQDALAEAGHPDGRGSAGV